MVASRRESEQPVLVEDSLVYTVELVMGSSDLLQKTSDVSELISQSIDLNSVPSSISGWSSSQPNNQLSQVSNLNNKSSVDLAVLRSLSSEFVEKGLEVSDVSSESLVLSLESIASISRLDLELIDENSEIFGLLLSLRSGPVHIFKTIGQVETKLGAFLSVSFADLNTHSRVDLTMLEDVNT